MPVVHWVSGILYGARFKLVSNNGGTGERLNAERYRQDFWVSDVPLRVPTVQSFDRSFVPQGIQCLTKLMPGAVDIGLDGSERQVERGGDFFVRPAFDVPQHYA